MTKQILLLKYYFALKKHKYDLTASITHVAQNLFDFLECSFKLGAFLLDFYELLLQ